MFVDENKSVLMCINLSFDGSNSLDDDRSHLY